MFDEFAKNILAANGGNSDNIYKNYSVSKIDASPASVAGNQAKAQASIDEQERQNALEISKKTKDAEDQRSADAADPSKASMVMKPDGSGYYFRDGTGKEMNINQFSLLTGKRPDELLADSDNPRDQRFVQDYKTMKDISSAWVNGDTATLQKYKAADPEKFNQLVSQYKTPGDMVNGFKSYYSDFYGNTQDANSASSNFSPQNIAAPDKATSKKLANTSFSQTIAPQPNITPPAHTAIGSNPLVWGAEHVPLLNRLTGRTDELNRQKDKLKSNPWYGYYNSLTGK